MNALHEKRSKKVKGFTTRSSIANLNPIDSNASLKAHLDAFNDATLLKVMSLANSSLTAVAMQTSKMGVWDADKLQEVSDLMTDATTVASTSAWREEIVMNASYVLWGYYRALGEMAYHNFVTIHLPDGAFSHQPTDEDYF